MSNFLNILADGLRAATTHPQLLLGIVAILLLSQFLLYSLLKRTFGDEFSTTEYFSLSLAGWLFVATFLSLIWFLFSIFLSAQISAFVTITLALAISLIFYFQTSRIKSTPSNFIPLTLILLTLLFILLRLSFVSKALLPLYFDSAQHYLLSKNILVSAEQSTISAGLLASYYHLGFHFLAAFITFITRAPINDILLLLGQIILGVIPLSFFFIIRYWTRSDSAGIFAVLLAAFGWYMPAHSMDWGKYPALASLALLPFILSLIYLSFQKITLAFGNYWLLRILAIAGIGVAVFLHSRAVIVFILLATTWMLAVLWQKTHRLAQHILFIALTLILISGIIYIQKRGLLGPLFDPYGPSGWMITSIILFLSIFAYWKYRGLVFGCVLTILLFLGSLFISLGNLVPGYANTTLLDRPFVEMILYIPLTLLGGFGLAGLEQLLQDKNMAWGNFHLDKVISLIFILAVIVNAAFKYNPYPSDCCVIVSQDDLSAIEWMNGNMPMDARILVSSTDLNVLPTAAFQGSAAGDAGAWINPLIGRPTFYMPSNTDFQQQQILDRICELQVGYIYVGKTGSPFNETGIDAQLLDYKLIFSLPKAKVYQVTGCP